jgi:multicomponent Na+:H+ antiporter subunit F
MSEMDVVVTVIQVFLGLGALLALVRALKGPELTDRMVAIDLVLILLAGGVAAHGARGGSDVFMPVVVAAALIVFASTVVVARFIEWRDTE